MRATLDIDEDVLHAAMDLAKRNGTTAGQILSDLARQALSEGTRAPRASMSGRETGGFLGFEPFAGRGVVVTDDLVNQIRESGPD